MKRRDDPAGYETLRNELKRIGVRVTALDKLIEEDSAGLRNPRHKPSQGDAAQPITRNDFYAYMPAHRYIFAPTRELWPGASVNARIPPVDVGADEADHGLGLARPEPAGRAADLVSRRADADPRPADRRGRLHRTAGLHDLQPLPAAATACPAIPARPALARPCAQGLSRRRRAHLPLAGAPRAEARREDQSCAAARRRARASARTRCCIRSSYAVGSWNFAEVTPVQLLGRFNGFIKSVILRINEARDLGEINRYAFYEHLQADHRGAARGAALRREEHPRIQRAQRRRRHHHVELPDRRLLPAARRSPPLCRLVAAPAGDLGPTISTKLYRWYEDEGGNRHVAAWLAAVNLADFNPKAPPQKTAAFWEIVDAERGIRGKRDRRRHRRNDGDRKSQGS